MDNQASAVWSDNFIITFRRTDAIKSFEKRFVTFWSPTSIQRKRHQFEDAARAYLEGVLSRLDETAVLSSNDWRLVIRACWIDGQPVVIKLWARPDVKGRLRHLFRASSSHHEWNNLQSLREAGVPVPAPVKIISLAKVARGYRYTEALIMEDLGQCDSAIDYLKRCIRTGDRIAQEAFESVLVEITAGMVKANVLDWDHSLVNTVISPSVGPVRLDLEQARKVKNLRAHYRLYGRMLGRLLGSYAFAVQPDLQQAIRFSERLFRELLPLPRVVRFAQREVDTMLSRQLEEIGLDSRFSLPVDYLRGSAKQSDEIYRD